jgi:MarR family transcriptional regulator for hemolysin
MKLTRERLDERMSRHGGSIQQWLILRILSDEPLVSHRELAERLLVSAPTVTHHLDRLEASGLLTRTRDTGDRRVVRVDLTPAGAERRTELEAVADAADAEVRSLLSPADAATLHQLLTTLHDRLTEASEGAIRAS